MSARQRGVLPRTPAATLATRAAAVLAGLALVGSLVSPATADPAGNDPTPPVAPDAAPNTTPDPAQPQADDPRDEALDSLAGVQEIFGDQPIGGQPGPDPEPAAAPEDATLALADLALTLGDLPPDLRRAARDYLSRPTDGAADVYGDGYTVPEATPVCSAVVCVHYVTRTADAVPLADAAPDNSVPDFVDSALSTLTSVHNKYVAAGYRSPLADGARGGNAKPDIYLADVGRAGLYGYCAPDADSPTTRTWAFCVMDNDYKRTQFPKNSPLANLQVTAAHEYFHAVQFGYDYQEDRWFLEATATWAEDELYDNVNDNAQYLKDSPISHPQRPLDEFGGLGHYGAWIFFRHLTERHRVEQGGMPTLVRDMFRAADAAPGARNDYSLEAVRNVLRARGDDFGRAFARFAQANRMTGRSYEEAKANRYPNARVQRYQQLSPSRRYAEPVTTKLDHLSSATYAYRPARNLRGARWRLALGFLMAKRVQGSTARITVYPTKGRPNVKRVIVRSGGKRYVKVPFNAAKIRRVEVTLINTSTRFTCNRNTVYSCAGRPTDDNRKATLKARVKKRG